MISKYLVLIQLPSITGVPLRRIGHVHVRTLVITKVSLLRKKQENSKKIKKIENHKKNRKIEKSKKKFREEAENEGEDQYEIALFLGPVVPQAPRPQSSSVPSSHQVPLVPWPRESLTVPQTLPMRVYPAPFFRRTPLKSIRFPVPEVEEGGGHGGGPGGGPTGPPAPRPGSDNLSRSGGVHLGGTR